MSGLFPYWSGLVRGTDVVLGPRYLVLLFSTNPYRSVECKQIFEELGLFFKRLLALMFKSEDPRLVNLDASEKVSA